MRRTRCGGGCRARRTERRRAERGRAGHGRARQGLRQPRGQARGARPRARQHLPGQAHRADEAARHLWPGYPRAVGRRQVSTPCYARITEELSRGWMSLAGAMGGHTVVAKLLLAYGTDEQKEAYLPRMATGELRATMALTEPGGGSDLQAMRTVARRDGEDYVVNGSKTWISNARRSGLTAVLLKTDPSAQPTHAGMSILLAE